MQRRLLPPQPIFTQDELIWEDVQGVGPWPTAFVDPAAAERKIAAMKVRTAHARTLYNFQSLLCAPA